MYIHNMCHYIYLRFKIPRLPCTCLLKTRLLFLCMQQAAEKLSMARKEYLRGALRILGSAACITAACVTIIILKYACMDNRAYAFVDGTCLGDSQMRAVVAALLTVALFFTALLVGDAVEALRSAMLTRPNGINEGIYIAMMPNSGMALRLRGCCTRHALLILVIAAFQYGPGASQTLSSLAIQTVPVYAKTSAVATLPPEPYHYNDTADGRLSATLDLPPLFSTAVRLVTTMGRYADGSSSIVYPNGTVTTSVIKILTPPVVPKSGHVDGPTDIISFNETVGNVTTTCVDAELLLENATDYTEYTKHAETYLLTLDVSGRATVIADNFTFSNINSAISISSQFTEFVFGSGFKVSCKSNLRFDVSKITYSLRTRNVQVLESFGPDITIDLANFSRLMQQSVGAPEYISNFLNKVDGQGDNMTALGRFLTGDVPQGFSSYYATFAKGFFGSGYPNILHTKVVSAVADGLGQLFSLQPELQRFVADAPSVTAESIANGTVTTEQIQALFLVVPVYEQRLQAYFPARYAWLLVGIVLAATWAVTICGLLSLVASPINVKTSNDISLVPCVEPATLATRTMQVACSAHLSHTCSLLSLAQ